MRTVGAQTRSRILVVTHCRWPAPGRLRWSADGLGTAGRGRHTGAVEVASLHVYPVKSGRGLEVPGSVVERCGLTHDRRWMVIHPDGRKLTAREDPRLLGIGAVPDGAGGRLP